MEINKKANRLLSEWDPFDRGNGAYPAEVEAVVEELQLLDHPADLAKRIREIYGFAYEVWIPIEQCMQISYKLIAIKYEAKSIV